MPSLSNQKNWRALRPPPTLIIFPKSTDQSSEIATLFSVVEKPYNYVFGNDLLPHSPRGRGYKLQTLDQCLHIVMDIGKCTGVFRRMFWLGEGLRRGGYVGGGGLSIEEFVMGEENFHEGSAGFTSII